MACNTENIPKEWKIKRTRTFIAFVLEAVALGMEYSLTFITLWLYLKELKSVHMNLHYSLISAAYLLAQIVSSWILGRIADSYRCVRFLFTLSNILVIVGNVLFTLPLSPWLLFAGRLISGGGGCLRCIMTGELARSYPEDEVSAKFSLMGMAFGLGFIVGPGINFAFIYLDFHIGPIRVWYVNAPGLYLSVIFIVLEFITLAMVSNLSKEYDLKDKTLYNYTPLNSPTPPEKEDFNGNPESELHLTLSNITKDESSCHDESHDESDYRDDTGLLADDPSSPGVSGVLSSIFTNIDTTLILVLSFFFMFCIVVFDVWQPRVNLELNHWTILEINLIIFGYGILTVAVLLVVTAFPISDSKIVYLSMVCTFCLSAVNVIFIVFTLINNLIVNIILWFLYALFFAIIVVMEEVFLIGVMAKMTSSRQQSFVESIRLGCSRCGALVALLSGAVLFDHLRYVCTALAVCGGVGILLIIWRKKQLQNPQVLIM